MDVDWEVVSIPKSCPRIATFQSLFQWMLIGKNAKKGPVSSAPIGFQSLFQWMLIGKLPSESLYCSEVIVSILVSMDVDWEGVAAVNS